MGNYWFGSDVEYILEKEIEEQTFIRRGFVLSENGKATKGLIQELEGEKILSNETKRILASKFKDNYIWLKSFPDKDESTHESRPLLVFTTTKQNNKYVIDGYAVFEQCILNADVFPLLFNNVLIERMDYIPENVYQEFNVLYNGRCATENFCLKGKPIPSAIKKSESEHVFKFKSAWRSVYSEINIKLNQQGIITNLNYCTRNNIDKSIINDDPAEYNDCINYICDQYNDEEWKIINVDNTASSSQINYNFFGKPYVSFLKSAEEAMNKCSPELLNEAFKKLKHLKLDDGYVLDFFTYNERHPYSKYSSSRDKDYNLVYAKKMNSDKEYSPELKKSLFEKVFNKNPEKITFINPDFHDDMFINSTVYTKQCLNQIPMTIEHISCPKTKEGVWELFLHIVVLNKWFGDIIFSKEEIEKMKDEERENHYTILPPQYNKVKNYDFNPEIIFDESQIIMKVIMRNGSELNLYKLEFINLNERFKVLKCKRNYITSLYNNPTKERRELINLVLEGKARICYGSDTNDRPIRY